MSHINPIPPAPSFNLPVVDTPLTMRELTETLIKHYGLHEGRYDLMIEFHLATGAFGPDPAVPLPGAAFAISRVGLTEANEHSTAPVDAAECNPRDPRVARPAKKSAPAAASTSKRRSKSAKD